MKYYQTTFDECLKKINELGGVCEGCGNNLEPIETVDNSNNPTFWRGCIKCSCFRVGVKKIYFDIARELVEKEIIIPYHFLIVEKNEGKFNTPELLEYYYQSQCAGLSHTIGQIAAMLAEREK